LQRVPRRGSAIHPPPASRRLCVDRIGPTRTFPRRAGAERKPGLNLKPAPAPPPSAAARQKEPAGDERGGPFSESWANLQHDWPQDESQRRMGFVLYRKQQLKKRRRGRIDARLAFRLMPFFVRVAPGDSGVRMPLNRPTSAASRLARPSGFAPFPCLPRLGEADLIARYFRAHWREPAGLGLRDDAALMRPTPGEDLVLTTDALRRQAVHFFADDPPGGNRPQGVCA